MRKSIAALVMAAVVCMSALSPMPVFGAGGAAQSISTQSTSENSISTVQEQDPGEEENTENNGQMISATDDAEREVPRDLAADSAEQEKNPAGESAGSSIGSDTGSSETDAPEKEGMQVSSDQSTSPEEDGEAQEAAEESLELIEMRAPGSGGTRFGILRAAAQDKTIRVHVTDDPSYYRYYGGYLKKHATPEGDSVYCMERVKSSQNGAYTLASNYWGNRKAEAACSYVLGNGQCRLGSTTRNAAYSTGNGNYDYAVTQMAVWGVLYQYRIQVDTEGIGGDRNAGFPINYQEITTGHGVKEKAQKLFQDAIAYADAHPDVADYVTPEVSIAPPSDISMKNTGNGYATDLYTLTARYGAAPDVTLTGDVPAGASIQKVQNTGSGYTFRVVLPSTSVARLSRGYSFQVQAGAGQTQYSAKLYRMASGVQAFSHALGVEITNPHPAAADVKVVPPAWVQLQKQSANPALTDHNPCYSLKGAVYGVYTDQNCTREAGRLTTGEDGVTNICKVPSVGTYYVRELTPSAGYRLDSTVYPVQLRAENTEQKPCVLSVKENPGADTAVLEVKKTDSEGVTVQGEASLEGTQFTICYYKGLFTEDNLPKEADRTWVIQSLRQDDGTFLAALSDKGSYRVSGDAFYTDEGGNVVLPYGTITIEETKAARGYLLDNRYALTKADETAEGSIRREGKFIGQILPSENGTEGNPGRLVFENQMVRESGITASDDVIRGDLQFKKIDENGKRMAGIPFLITSKTTGEKHVIVSDENGIVSTSSRYRRHSVKTNALDGCSDGKRFTDEAKLDGTTGIWFGERSALSDTRGALPYDTYEVRELQCQANKGKELVLTSVSIRENNGVLWLDPAMNPDIVLKTTALEKSTGSRTAPAGKTVTIEDTVVYNRLTPGRSYTLQGSVVKKDDAGQVIAVARKAFTPEKTKGSLVMNFSLDTSGLEGTELVVMEKLYWDGMEIASHQDTSDKSQTIRVPEIRTEAADKKSGTHSGTVEEKAVLTDCVSYEGLDPARTYTLAGTVCDPETGEALKNEAGEPLTAEKTFRPGSYSGKVYLDIPLDSRELAGRTVVIFETLKDGEITAAVHKEKDDEQQMVHFPKIGTEAADQQTKGKQVAVGEKSGLMDTVRYENLIPDTEYVLRGILYDRETGKPVRVGGKTVTAERTFAPRASGGTEALRFEFSSLSLEGKDLVVFEKLMQEGAELTSHEDLTDAAQTVQVPKVRTTATDGQTDTHTGAAAEKATVRDHVKAVNLVVGKTYTLRGTLLRKDTGKALQREDGTPVTAERSFTADRKDMEMDLVFSFSSLSLAGKSAVAFETLSQGDVEVASHADLADEDQTVHYPSVSTQADAGGKKQAQADGKTVITDHITCRNLVPGNTYTLKGVLYSKADGKPLRENGKEITAEKTFRASEADGVVDMTFTLNTSSLAGQTVVVFENLYHENVLTASHADLNSADQSVTITARPASGTKTTPKTGDPTEVLPLMLLSVAAAAGAVILWKKKRRAV